jgi:hypothetical protein
MAGSALLRRVILVTLGLVALGPTYGRCDILYVDQNAPGPVHNGQSWAQAFLTTQEALAAARNGDDVWVAAGTYRVHRDLYNILPNGVALYGGFPPGGGTWESRDWVANETVIDGTTVYPTASATIWICDCPSERTRVDGFTITACSPGIYIARARPAIENNTLTGNHVYRDADPRGGGGIRSADAAPTIRSNVISDNGIGDHEPGGGICLLGDGGGSPLIEGNTICENEAETGGGIYANSTAALIRNNTITGNVALAGTGGICCEADQANAARLVGYPHIEGNAITANQGAGVTGLEMYCWPTVIGNAILSNAGNGVSYASRVEGNEIGDNIGCGVSESSPVINNHIYGNRPSPLPHRGGGVAFWGESDPTALYHLVAYNLIEDNEGVEGGGVSNAGAVIGNVIRGNRATRGGGVFSNVRDAMVTYNRIELNSADEGGGICVYAGDCQTVTRNTIDGNTAIRGGGVYSNWCDVVANTITNNCAAEAGGGIYGDAPAMSNLIAGNSAALGSGFCCTSGGSLWCNTFAGNQGGGGALFWPGTYYVGVVDNIVAFNESGLVGSGTLGQMQSNCVYGNALFDYQGVDPGEGDINEDPLFVDPADGDYHILPESPCLDTAYYDPWYPYGEERDMDGEPRYMDGNGDAVAQLDIGADEHLPDPLITTAPADLFLPGWSWFSIPLVPLGSSEASDVLGFDARNRVFAWDEAARTLILYPDDFVDLAVGQSYVMFLRPPEQHVPSYAGLLPGERFELPLVTMGWSWVGTPWPTDVNPQDLLLVKGGDVRTVWQDAHRGDAWVNWNWIYWDSVDQTAEIMNPFAGGDDDRLRSWWGYRIWAYTEDVTIVFP